MCALHAFGVKGAVSTGRVVAVDLPHHQQHPHLQSCWQKNLGLEGLKTIAKVGVACCPPCPQKRNISPHRCLNPLQFLVFDSETADQPILHEKSHFALMKTVVLVMVCTANSQLTQVSTSA